MESQLTQLEPALKDKIFAFSFQGDRFSNTPYVLVKGSQYKEIVKDPRQKDFEKERKKAKSFNFAARTSRKGFVDPSGAPNENRFGLPDTYDKSTYLTSVKRSKMPISFERQIVRDEKLIEKGGDTTVVLSHRSQKFYDTFKKDKTMNRLDNGIVKHEKVTAREDQSLYKQNDYKDFFDNLKAAKTQTHLKTKRKDAFVDMRQQTKRDFTKILCNTEAYKNIQRDNARQDYVKALLKG